jgi:hypothetical protein
MLCFSADHKKPGEAALRQSGSILWDEEPCKVGGIALHNITL